MAKSLTETAKQILMKESDDPTPDRDAKKMTPNAATLRPASKNPEGPFANPGSMAPNGMGETEDLGPAVVTPNDELPDASGKMKKDSSKSSRSSVKAEQPTEQSAIMEDEEYEISEELENFINEMIEEGYSEEEIAQAIEENFEFVTEEDVELEEEKEDDDEDDKKEKMDEERIASIQEHVDALLSGENLSEEFRSKAEVIFESAVSERVNQEVQVLEEAYAKTLAEEVTKAVDDLTEQVNSYLSYVVEQWIEQNEVAIETGLRTEITEEFISGLRTLFAENYIDIPDEKVSVVEGLAEKVEKLENKLNEEISKNIELTKTLNESIRHELIQKSCDGLTETEKDKMLSLAENVTFSDVEDFEAKLETLRESYFPKTVKSPKELDLTSVEEGSDGNFITEELSGPMAAYVRTLGKKLPT